MSTLTGKKPISVVIFDRSTAGLSDVPVFSQKLKAKVNTPIAREVSDVHLTPATLKILEEIKSEELVADSFQLLEKARNPQEDEKRSILQANSSKLTAKSSVLRADSSGGQTGEFAQSTETPVTTGTQHPAFSVQSEKIEKQDSVASENVLFDDPSLVRFHHNATVLLDLINPRGVEWVTAPKITVFAPTQKRLLKNHTQGLVDVTVLPSRQLSIFDRYETLWYAAKRAGIQTGRVVRSTPQQFKQVVTQMSVTTLTLARAKAAQLQQAVRAVKFPTFKRPQIILPTVTVPTVPLPKVSRPTIVIPSIVFPEIHFVRLTSRILLAGSLVLMLMTVGPMVVLEAQSWKQKISYAISTIPSHASDSSQQTKEVKPTPEPTINPAPDKQFQIIIPKIGVNSKVIANVDAGDEKAYGEALKKGVAHAAGTGLPGEPNTDNKTIFIFGHSTNGEWNISRYNALFYALKDMIVGDTFSIWFWGKEFHYKITETKVVAANDVSFLTQQTDKDQLILQTCWPPGTSWKRFLVIAEPVK